MDDRLIFSTLVAANRWGGRESSSGLGSDLANTKHILRELPKVFHKLLGVRSLVDAPCGDMNWMPYLDYKFDAFVGVELLPELIEKHLSETWPTGFHFQVGNVTTDILPQADAILFRDCLVHLPVAKIHQATYLFKRAGFRYLIATTFAAKTKNSDCGVGDWRSLNMSIEPFKWGEPLFILPEVEQFENKSLGVWTLANIEAHAPTLSDFRSCDTGTDIAAIERELRRGPDGWTNPVLYKAAYEGWVNKGGLTGDFVKSFPPEQFVNPDPVNKWLPEFLRNPHMKS